MVHFYHTADDSLSIEDGMNEIKTVIFKNILVCEVTRQFSRYLLSKTFAKCVSQICRQIQN
jgi:hypothetical protein